MLPLKDFIVLSFFVFLQDKYDNLVTEGYDGEVILTVLGPGTEIPTLVGGTRTSSFPMKNGQATLQVRINNICLLNVSNKLPCLDTSGRMFMLRTISH